MLASVFKSALLLAGVSGVAAASQLTQSQAKWYAQAIESGMPRLAPAYIQSDQLSNVLIEWKRLQQSDNYPFSDYANFLLAHPGWPGETSRRAAAETVLDSGTWSPGLVIRFFERFAPLTAAGRLRYAEALAASGKRAEAEEQARRAWRGGSLRPADETKLTGAFFSALTPADHDARADMLIWRGQTTAATRQLGYVSPSKRALFEARIAYRSKVPDAATRGAAVAEQGRGDPGYIADRATWLRESGQGMAMRSYLAEPRRLNSFPGDVEKWYEVLLLAARGAASDGQNDLAYRIASQVDDAYPAGTDISDRPYGERDDYTSLTWLAGTVALEKAGRARGFPDLYYGQLAAERLGNSLKRPPDFNAKIADPAVREAFFRREVVRAAQLLGTMGNRPDQSLFVRQIAQDATTDTDHILAAELSRTIGRPDLGVMVGRSALQNGLSDYTAAGYPSVRVPEGQQDYWTIIHAIARQESQFDRAAVSHAGARGLMQLMPGTAREQSGKLGLAYNRDSLTVDTDYNIQLGSSYFQRMLNLYGSYPLAVAAYNAGPGNVNKWLAANGDPRTSGIDVVTWVEKIPIFETKNYVQRVLENAVVYDLLNPERSRSKGPANLSWYLGKSRPG
ncbi:MAG: lytic transglycosylase domain-containing protein [Sphingomonadales bacterium]|nr:MAG: lytic transglycosylase domain-containing protein [Sphingomonadales bacterium]